MSAATGASGADEMDGTDRADGTATRLGRAAALRFRRPGPPAGRARPPLIGSVAAASARFAQGWGRPVAVRRALAGPGPAAQPRPAGTEGLDVRPPRWWVPDRSPAGHQAGDRRPPGTGADGVDGGPGVVRPRPALPTRGLRRVVERMPDEQTRRPGDTPARLAPRVVPMRLPEEVAAAGRMTTAADARGRRLPPRRAARTVQTPASPASGSAEEPNRPTVPPSRSPSPGASRPASSPSSLSAADGRPGADRSVAVPATGPATAPGGEQVRERGTVPARGVPGGATAWPRLVRRRARVRQALDEHGARTGRARGAAPTASTAGVLAAGTAHRQERGELPARVDLGEPRSAPHPRRLGEEPGRARTDRTGTDAAGTATAETGRVEPDHPGATDRTEPGSSVGPRRAAGPWRGPGETGLPPIVRRVVSWPGGRVERRLHRGGAAVRPVAGPPASGTRPAAPAGAQLAGTTTPRPVPRPSSTVPDPTVPDPTVPDPTVPDTGVRTPTVHAQAHVTSAASGTRPPGTPSPADAGTAPVGPDRAPGWTAAPTSSGRHHAPAPPVRPGPSDPAAVPAPAAVPDPHRLPGAGHRRRGPVRRLVVGSLGIDAPVLPRHLAGRDVRGAGRDVRHVSSSVPRPWRRAGTEAPAGGGRAPAAPTAHLSSTGATPRAPLAAASTPTATNRVPLEGSTGPLRTGTRATGATSPLGSAPPAVPAVMRPRPGPALDAASGPARPGTPRVATLGRSARPWAPGTVRPPDRAGDRPSTGALGPLAGLATAPARPTGLAVVPPRAVVRRSPAGTLADVGAVARASGRRRRSQPPDRRTPPGTPPATAAPRTAPPGVDPFGSAAPGTVPLTFAPTTAREDTTMAYSFAPQGDAGAAAQLDERAVADAVERRVVDRLETWLAADLDVRIVRIVEDRLQEEIERRAWRGGTGVF